MKRRRRARRMSRPSTRGTDRAETPLIEGFAAVETATGMQHGCVSVLALLLLALKRSPGAVRGLLGRDGERRRR